MDDTCAVCADTLEWVAYGICGHKDVCSTCVVRLRFICGDNCCCICKTESKTIFVTKALGDYTKAISDFSVFPSKDKEGQSGSYWYHEDTRSYFDDFEQYKMVNAMCKLSCSVCDKAEGEKTDNGSKRRARCYNIHQLQVHLSNQHRLFMCNLCLKGRKVFICEQKLYTKAQLEQHKSTGNTQVDRTESERGGFNGHVLCKYCRTWFYEDNELYRHMETEHYQCFICKRRNIGKYNYYKNYDDLENHFRQEHFYCEEAVCFSKKFVIFPSEAELKIHRTQEHAGHMSRAKHNAILQVYICEQKLYSKAQLRQHINTGDSEVDGTEIERGGFQGHPLCEFCRTPFYGDNELYTHMNTEHFNCHICRRQNPGKYEYYKN